MPTENWPKLGSLEDADATHRWARECLKMWERERAELREALEAALCLAEDAHPAEARTMRARFLNAH